MRRDATSATEEKVEREWWTQVEIKRRVREFIFVSLKE
jgi:hypothetical protein